MGDNALNAHTTGEGSYADLARYSTGSDAGRVGRTRCSTGGRGHTGARLPLACSPAHRLRAARRRGLLVTGWIAPRVSERTRAGQSLLSNLPAGSDERRRQTDLKRRREDDVRVLPPRYRRDHVLVHAPRSEVAAVSKGRARLPCLGERAALLVGLRP